VGAPPTLVEAAHRAAADEERHAALCFRAASALSGDEHVALPLESHARFDGRSSGAIVTLALESWHDGCLGESIAAEAISDAGRLSKVDWIRSLNEGLAEDERRHGDLAWQILEWCWSTRDEATRTAILEAAGAASESTGVETTPDDADLLEWYGQASSRMLRRCQEKVFSRGERRIRALVTRA
jgi:hypothetical protein